MLDPLINPTDSVERQNAKLLVIAQVLMRRVEQITDDSGAAYAQFQRAAMLEDQVRERTRDLERALGLLNQSNAQLAQANDETEAARRNLADAIETIQEGFALFDAADVMVMCNSRFGMYMTDIRPDLRAGLSFGAYVALVSHSAQLELPEGLSPDEWAVRRLKRHHEAHVIFNVAMRGDAWVQVSEHRTREGGTVILQTDVTDIIRLERQERGKMLDEQARMIRATLDHLNQGVTIFDANAQLVGWNRRLLDVLALPLSSLIRGVSFETLLARIKPATVFSDAWDEMALRVWVQSGQGQAEARGDVRRGDLNFEIRRGGAILDVFVQEMPDGGFVMSFTDVTAERVAIEALSRANETLEARVSARTLQLEDALADAERANASRSRFVAAASHDLLQPLSAAKLFLSAIGADGLGTQARAALDKAQNALMSVEGILDALLNISKLESGKAAVSVGAVRLDQVLMQLQDEFSAIAAAKGLDLVVRPSGAVVLSDPAYLRRILQNLIGNALRYTDQGRVLVGARKRGQGLQLQVWDTGAGIPAQELGNIFKEFHRLNARASASEGMGLGLAIVERACALLGHPLEVRSTLGRGSVFTLEVPLAQSQTALAAAPLARTVQPVALNRILLLVENDDGIRAALVHLLETWGISVLEAASAPEALALLEELGILPDAVLADQHLGPEMTGLHFLRALFARYGRVPALVISADRSAALQGEVAGLGVGFLPKPLDTAALQAFLQGLPAPLPTTKGP